MKYFLFAFAALFLSFSQAQPGEKDINKIISNLTIEEKAFLVVGTGMDIPGFSEQGPLPEAVVGTTKGKVPGAAGTSYVLKKFNLPAVVFADGPAGIRIDPKRENAPEATFYATAFPVASALASSWDEALLTEVGKAFGEEAKAYGVDFLLAPALNIHRNPLGGRNFEYYSEDPLISGKMAAAFVRGVQSEGVGATIKHFVANNSETNRTALNTVVSERALREIYLRGFEIAVKEGKPWSVMSSYNKINGTYASENKELLTTILRDEWNFDGFVMTDWFGGKDPVAQMNAGNDLLMPGTTQQVEAIIKAVQQGTLDEAVLDRNISNLLVQYFKTGAYRGQTPSGKPSLELHKTVARKAASESMVLLKNNQALPLKNRAKIALFGIASYETIAGGTGSGDVNKAYMVSVENGLRNQGYLLDASLNTSYHAYLNTEKSKLPKKNFFFEPDILVPEKTFTPNELNAIAGQTDLAIFTLGRTSGEFYDRAKGDFYLSDAEESLLKDLSKAYHQQGKKFIVLMNIGGIMETERWKDLADGIIIMWQPGQEAGNAIADVLSGVVNPSGKLASTFPVRLEDIPSGKNFPGHVLNPDAPANPNPLTGVPSEEVYEEGIYIGYRYFDSFGVPPSYPFGYGLSYTSFEYSNLEVTVDETAVKVIFTVKNSGDMAGKDVAQVYVAAPKGNSQKPQKELKAFVKTTLLKPRKSQKITILIPQRDLTYFDTDKHQWVLDAGSYNIMVASDVLKTRFSAPVSLPGRNYEKTNKVLLPLQEINELSKN